MQGQAGIDPKRTLRAARQRVLVLENYQGNWAPHTKRFKMGLL
jgi:hypothetical protein